MTNDELINKFSSGIEEGRYVTVFCESKNFAVFKVKGHMSWYANWSPWQYSPVQYVLVRKGDWWLGSKTVTKIWKGRTKKFEIIKALHEAESCGKVK